MAKSSLKKSKKKRAKQRKEVDPKYRQIPGKPQVKRLKKSERALDLEVDAELAKQRAIVNRLRNENKAMELELSLDKHLSSVTGRESAKKEIEALQSTSDKLARRIQQEKRKIEQLDAQITETHEKIAKQKLRVGGANASVAQAKVSRPPGSLRNVSVCMCQQSRSG